MFFACRIWCVADVSSVSPSSEQPSYPAYSPTQKKTVFSKLVFKLFCSLLSRRATPEEDSDLHRGDDIPKVN